MNRAIQYYYLAPSPPSFAMSNAVDRRRRLFGDYILDVGQRDVVLRDLRTMALGPSVLIATVHNIRVVATFLPRESR
jgi:hypothetical protein